METKPKENSVLELAFQMGSLLLESGAEIFRIQETMERVVQSGQVERYGFYVLTNAIFANGMEQGVAHTTQIKFVKGAKMHIGRISAVNQLSRELVAGERTVGEAFERLAEIRAMPLVGPPWSLLCCGIGCACFCYVLAGSGIDLLCSFFCGFLLESFLYFTDRYAIAPFIQHLLASALVALLACLFAAVFPGVHMDMVITGGIVRLVPGVALTTSIRDFFNGDYLSGTIRLIDALMMGVSLAIGAGLVMRLYSMITGGLPL